MTNSNHPTMDPVVRDIYQVALNDLEQRAREALAEGNMDAHMAFGRGFHSLADHVLERHGVELRPTE